MRVCSLLLLPPAIVGTAGKCESGNVDSPGSRLTVEPCTGSPTLERCCWCLRAAPSYVIADHRLGRQPQQSPTSSPTPAAPPTTPISHVSSPPSDPPGALSLPQVHPGAPPPIGSSRAHSPASDERTLPPGLPAPPPDRPRATLPAGSSPLRGDTEATWRPGYSPEPPAAGGGPLRTVDSTGRWLRVRNDTPLLYPL